VGLCIVGVNCVQYAPRQKGVIKGDRVSTFKGLYHEDIRIPHNPLYNRILTLYKPLMAEALLNTDEAHNAEAH
jgi:hypothetical protein